ncbi:hypothetical protein C8A00DRAFT_14692 [Chaetomidium leptoderma]|uniref:AMP-activated protein kinase glycogen-binding domain-containing protein n=1 Tax=Chaetomidium leptoderma TaxID=669021 RepID=A0AAN6ZXS1_9PEZI|nr:hypothetical protein C8A00DRAFT_14692 [Chaetomidium leptoderma]
MRSFTFKWPHDAQEVYVTGTFDNWTKSERLDRVGQVFEKTVTLPESSDKIYYKFVVDGSWITDHVAPQEKDHEGNDNNVLLPEQMDQLEEASLAAAINNLVPESTTAQLAGAVPLEEKKDDGKVGGGGEASSDAAILSSAAPDSTTAQLAAAVPREEETITASPPGTYPETPLTELDKEVKIDPLPAAEGAINPIKLEAGEKVPNNLTAGAVDSHVTLDKESYEKSDRIPGIETTLPFVTGHMIPESSLPITSANDVTINTVTPEATTAILAGKVPLEAKVPEIVKQSQEEAKVDPEASANSEEVTEKAAVEEELLKKVTEAPSTSEGTAGKGTEKSETDKTAAEQALAAATSAGEVAVGAAIVAAGAAGVALAGAATKATGAATEIAAKASDAAADLTSKATNAASDAATNLPPAVKGILPGAAEEAKAEAEEKQKAAIDSVSSEVPAAVKESMKEAGASPEAAVNTAAVVEKKGYEAEIIEKVESSTKARAAEETKAKADEEQKAAIDSVSAEVPAEVKESMKEAGASPEAAVNTAAVEEKKQYEAEILEKVKPSEVVGESSTKAAEEQTALAVEPPQPVMAVKAVDEAKSVETPKPTEDIKLTEDIAPAVEALVVEPPKPVESVKAVDVAPPAEAAKVADEPTAVVAPAEVAAPTEVETPKAAVEHPAAAEGTAPAAAIKAGEAHPATNGTTATATTPAPTSSQTTADKATSEKKKKHRISGFFTKLKHKFA